MKVVAIVGSIREDSYNKKLAKFVQKRYQDRFDLEILDISVLPFYNQDIELDPPEEVIKFKAKVKAADAVLWVTPEYNASIPGVLANAIDWLSRVGLWGLLWEFSEQLKHKCIYVIFYLQTAFNHQFYAETKCTSVLFIRKWTKKEILQMKRQLNF